MPDRSQERANSGGSITHATASFQAQARLMHRRATREGRPGPLDADMSHRTIVDQVKLLLEQALLEPPGLPWLVEAGAWVAVLNARVVRERLLAPESSDEDEAAA